MRWLKKSRPWLPIIIYLIPILIGYWYVFTYSVNYPFWDQWDMMVPWTIKWYEGKFGFEDLFGLYNDSRLTFPILIILFLSLTTSLNIKLFYVVSFTIYLIALAALFYLIRRDGLGEQILLSPILFYALNPYYLVRFILNIGAFTSPFTILVAIITTHFIYKAKNSYTNMFLSVITGFVCSFSFVFGFTIWFSGLAQLILQRMIGKWKKVAIWIASTAFTFYSHLILLGFRQEHPIHSMEAYQNYALTALNYPIHKFLCFIGAIGAEVTHYKEMALPFGFVILLIFLSILLANKNHLNLDRYSKWYGLLIFGVLTSLELALTRSGDIGNVFGPPDNVFFVPLMGHQSAFFLPIICIYVLGIAYTKDSSKSGNESTSVAMLGNRKEINAFLVGAIFILLISSAIIHFPDGWRTGEVLKQNGEIGAYIVTTYKIQSDENIRNYLYPDPAIVRERAQFLEENKLSAFSEPRVNLSDLRPIGPDALFSVDTINGKAIAQQPSPIAINASREETITICGWAVDKGANDSASAVFVTIDGKLDIPALYGLDRPDVAKAFDNPKFRHSGFMATFSSRILGRGEHALGLKIVARDGRGYYRPEGAVRFAIE
jgi:hypothetical protein